MKKLRVKVAEPHLDLAQLGAIIVLVAVIIGAVILSVRAEPMPPILETLASGAALFLFGSALQGKREGDERTRQNDDASDEPQGGGR